MKDSPHPHLPFSFGLVKVNSALQKHRASSKEQYMVYLIRDLFI